MLLISNPIQSQVRYVTKDNFKLVVSGTSTMHDWDMKTSTGNCDAIINVDGSGKLIGISKMNFKTQCKSLVSGKGSMDKNAYKALKADKIPEITAVLSSAEISTNDGKIYTAKCKIKLTIAGFTQETSLNGQIKDNGNNTITVTGEKKISMKEFEMDPPSFMLGAVKTGNDVILKFDITLVKE